MIAFGPKSIRGKVTLAATAATAIAMALIVVITAYAMYQILTNTISNSLDERLDQAQAAVQVGNYQGAMDLAGSDMMQIIDANGNVIAETANARGLAAIVKVVGESEDDERFETLELERDDEKEDEDDSNDVPTTDTQARSGETVVEQTNEQGTGGQTGQTVETQTTTTTTTAPSVSPQRYDNDDYDSDDNDDNDNDYDNDNDSGQQQTTTNYQWTPAETDDNDSDDYSDQQEEVQESQTQQTTQQSDDYDDGSDDYDDYDNNTDYDSNTDYDDDNSYSQEQTYESNDYEDDSDDSDDYDDYKPAPTVQQQASTQSEPDYDDNESDSDDDSDDDDDDDGSKFMGAPLASLVHGVMSRLTFAAASAAPSSSASESEASTSATTSSSASTPATTSAATSSSTSISTSTASTSSAASSKTSTSATPVTSRILKQTTYVDASDVLGEEGPYLVKKRQVKSPDGMVTLAAITSLASAAHTAQLAVHLLIVLFLALLCMVVAFTWNMAARTLSPVETMRRTAESITTSDLSARIPVPEKDKDLSKLAHTFNDLLARVESSFNEQRRFVSDASHELKSPVAATGIMLETLREHPEAVDSDQIVKDLTTENNRLGSIVRDLLMLARSDEGRLQIDSKPIDLMDLLLEEVASLRTRSTISVDTSGIQPIVCQADAGLLSHVVRNLLDNAARFAKTQVKVSCMQHEDVVSILISDDGCGIAPEDRERVFERFARLDNSRHDKSSTGLGLPVARSIVERHQGTLQFIDGELGGATALICIPAF